METKEQKKEVQALIAHPDSHNLLSFCLGVFAGIFGMVFIAVLYLIIYHGR